MDNIRTNQPSHSSWLRPSFPHRPSPTAVQADPDPKTPLTTWRDLNPQDNDDDRIEDLEAESLSSISRGSAGFESPPAIRCKRSYKTFYDECPISFKDLIPDVRAINTCASETSPHRLEEDAAGMVFNYDDDRSTLLPSEESYDWQRVQSDIRDLIRGSTRSDAVLRGDEPDLDGMSEKNDSIVSGMSESDESVELNLAPKLDDQLSHYVCDNQVAVDEGNIDEMNGYSPLSDYSYEMQTHMSLGHVLEEQNEAKCRLLDGRLLEQHKQLYQIKESFQTGRFINNDEQAGGAILLKDSYSKVMYIKAMDSVLRHPNKYNNIQIEKPTEDSLHNRLVSGQRYHIRVLKRLQGYFGNSS